MDTLNRHREAALPSAQRASAVLDGRRAPYALLLLRTALGAVFMAHALLKLLVLGLPHTAEFFAAHGYPAWSAYPVFALQLGGGVALVLGIYPRLVALALVPVMLGALLVHVPNGWRFDSPGGGWEFVAFLLVALLVQAAGGDGAHALRPSRRG